MTPPDWLDEVAKAEWGRVARSGMDVTVLAAYCLSYSRWVAAEKIVNSEGTEVVLRDDKGVVKSVSVSPQLAIANKMLDRMLKTGATLGISANLRGAAPVARVQQPETNSGFFKGVN